MQSKEINSKNVDKINITPYGEDKSNEDIIPFKFYDVYNEKHITFRAIYLVLQTM